MKYFAILFLSIIVSLSLLSYAHAEDNYEEIWTKQFGTSGYDDIQSSSIDDSTGNIAVAGRIYVSQGSSLGQYDAFLKMINPLGFEVWTKQIGTVEQDFLTTTFIDDSTGNIVAGGFTLGNLYGINAGKTDAFLIMYDSEGNELWTKQFGTSENDYIQSSSIDDSTGNIVVAGKTEGDLDGVNAGITDIFLRMYDSEGNELWTKQFGTSSWDVIKSISINSNGNIIVTGYTTGNLQGTNAGGWDGFLRMYDSNGNELWTEQFGTSEFDKINTSSIDTSNGNILVAGGSLGSLDGTNAGSSDAFMRMYDSNGNVLWTEQFGTSENDYIQSSSIDGSTGNIVVVGKTGGDLDGVNAGSWDSFLRMYDSNGNELWTKQFGTSENDQLLTSSIDTSNGNIIVAGRTEGDLEGTNAGSNDAFVRAYGNIHLFEAEMETEVYFSSETPELRITNFGANPLFGIFVFNEEYELHQQYLQYIVKGQDKVIPLEMDTDPWMDSGVYLVTVVNRSGSQITMFIYTD